MSRESRTHFQTDHPQELEVEPGEGHGQATGGGAGAGGESASAAGAPGSDAQIEALRRQLATAEQNAQAQRELYLRSAAELENVRKRAQRDIEQAHRYAIEGLATELLPVRDSLELGLASGANADAKTLLEEKRRRSSCCSAPSTSSRSARSTRSASLSTRISTRPC